jgi:mannitol/fructose-specific phosphotransferase system IIA component (Ntr-type)
LLSELLTEDRIQIQKSVRDWREALTLAAEPLLADGSIESSYVDGIIRSVEEQGPYIVLMKHLALAHARPEEGVNCLALSALTLKEPINFGNPENDPVKVIFCLAAEGTKSHLKLMGELASLFEDEKLKQLIEAKDSKEFRKYLFSSAKKSTNL